MKKSLLILLLVFLVVSLAGCAPRSSTPKTSSTSDPDSQEGVEKPLTVTETAPMNDGNKEPTAIQTQGAQDSGSVEVDANLLTVTITIPASRFDMTEDFDPVAYSEKNGFKNTVVNEDGSVTITMSKNKHNELMAQMKESVDQSFEDMIGAENTPYIKAITSSDGYKTVTVDVDKVAYEATFDMTPFIIGMVSLMYQTYADVDLHCEVLVRDINTGEILASAIYPDNLNN